MEKKTMITLEYRVGEKVLIREVELGQAEKILRLRRQGGYSIPKNSKYQFVNNGLQLKSN